MEHRKVSNSGLGNSFSVVDSPHINTQSQTEVIPDQKPSESSFLPESIASPPDCREDLSGKSDPCRLLCSRAPTGYLLHVGMQLQWKQKRDVKLIMQNVQRISWANISLRFALKEHQMNDFRWVREA